VRTINDDKRSVSDFRRQFGTLARRFATQRWIVFAILLSIPCLAQPPGIVYSTTVPYAGVPDDMGYTPPATVSLLVTDASGNSYIAGAVASTGLPTTPGVVQPGFAGGTCPTTFDPQNPCSDTFIAKFDSTGALVFLTYLGGTGNDVPYGLAVDASGNIYVGGITDSTNFPLAGTPWQPTLTNPGTFISKLSGDGKTLIWSTVLNGNLRQLAIGPDGSVYYLSQTSVEANGTITISEALTKLTSNGQFVTTVNTPSGTPALAVGTDGSVYIGGITGGPGNPPSVTATPGAWQTIYNGGSDGFLAKMNPSLSGFAWVTFVGGSQMNAGAFDVVDVITPAPDGTLWITGNTTESDFPVLAGALQSQPQGGSFLVHLSANGSQALASTYLPIDLGSLALDGSGNVIFSGNSQNGFQATAGSQWPCQQSVNGDNYPGYFGKIDSAAQRLLWDTWVGPSVPIGPAAADNNGNAIAAGSVPGSEDITLTAMTTTLGSPRLVESCIAQSGSPYASAAPLAAGEIFSIYGAGFGPEQGVAAQPSGNTIGTQLGGVQVLIENTPAPLLYVSSVQINLVAPYLLDGRTAAHIKIETADATSNEVVLGVRQAMPEIFETQSSGAAILNQDGSLNSQDHPAHVGDTVSMFASGVGQTNPPGVDGAIPEAAGGAPVLPIQVQLNFTAYANVTYAGNAPGLISGATQVNFQIPQVNLVGAGPPYQVQIILYAGAASSGTGEPIIWIE
jgi:uncharacterized protein (TIGR03437 family)